MEKIVSKLYLSCDTMNNMKKMILLILPALLFTGCAVKEKEMEITLFGNTVPAIYTGRVKKKLPHGEGTAVMENDARAEGIFELGTYISGKIESIPYTITYRDQEITGIYTGEVNEQMPSGNGTFTSDTFSYTGIWTDGNPEGPGTVTAAEFCIDTPAEVLTGSYSGDFARDKAEGSGTFTYQSGNEEVQLEGNFTDNRFDGPMTKTVRYQDTVKTYPVYYRSGRLEDTAVALIAYLEGMRNESYCLSVEQLSFISDHAGQFEGNVKEADISALYNHTFDYAGFKEDDTPELIMIRNAAVRSVQRYKPYAGADTVTSMIVQNNDGWYHLVFAYSEDSADPGEYVDICALPLCHSTITAPEQNYPCIDAAGVYIIGG